MTINLQKGQKIDLTKGKPGLNTVMVGLGWDEKKSKNGGFLNALFGGNTSAANFDCDASVIMLDANEKLTKKENLVYFGNLTSPCHSVRHSGDNLTGAGSGDDEQIQVTLNQVPSSIQKLVFAVNIYDCQKRRQDFGLIQNAYIRIVDFSNNQELCRYNLTEIYAGKTALIAGELYRYNSDWKFNAIGEGTTEPSLSALANRYC